MTNNPTEAYEAAKVVRTERLRLEADTKKIADDFPTLAIAMLNKIATI